MISQIARAFLFLVFTITPAFAEQFGTITVTYDGKERQWFTISGKQGGKLIATAEIRSSGPISTVHIQGHPRPSYTAKDVLSIDLVYLGAAEKDADPTGVEIIHLPDGMSGEIWTSEQSPQATRVIFSEFNADGDTGRLSGTIEALLCRKATAIAEPDTSNCRPIAGDFDTKILVSK